MRVTINGAPVIDEQDQLFFEVKENFSRIIEEYRRKHWFKEFIYEFTGGEDLIDTDRIRALLWYWKLRLVLKSLRISLIFFKPDQETAEKLIEVLTELRDRMEAD